MKLKYKKKESETEKNLLNYLTAPMKQEHQEVLEIPVNNLQTLREHLQHPPKKLPVLSRNIPMKREGANTYKNAAANLE